jgi:hypothetical protein
LQVIIFQEQKIMIIFPCLLVGSSLLGNLVDLATAATNLPDLSTEGPAASNALKRETVAIARRDTQPTVPCYREGNIQVIQTFDSEDLGYVRNNLLDDTGTYTIASEAAALTVKTPYNMNGPFFILADDTPTAVHPYFGATVSFANTDENLL